MTKSHKPATETIRETLTCEGLSLAVDREAGVIRGVKVLGPQSRNGREYTADALRKGVGLYEGVRVNINHVKPGQPRGYADRIGRLESPRVQSGGIYADLRFNPKHALAEQLAWDAENAPGNVGLSHDAEGRLSRAGGKTLVEEILSVRSVDLVADPATTGGLFEGEIGDKMNADAQSAAIRKVNGTAMDLIHQAVWDDEGAYPTLAAKKARVLAVLADWEAELGTLAATDAGDDSTTDTETEESMDFKALTADELAKQRPDLVEAITKPLQEQLDTLTASENARKRDASIAEALQTAGMDAGNKTVCSDLFMEQLRSAPDDKRAQLIEDRKALIGTADHKQPISHSPHNGGAFPDRTAFVSSLRG